MIYLQETTMKPIKVFLPADIDERFRAELKAEGRKLGPFTSVLIQRWLGLTPEKRKEEYPEIKLSDLS